MSTWNLDPSHTTVAFAVKHLMISTVRGRFANVSASIYLDEQNSAASHLDVSVDVASVDTRSEQRDNHLRSADFFDLANHPSITFKSKRIEGDLAGDFQVIGALSIRGVTREVALNASFGGEANDPWGNQRRAFSAKGSVNREDFGLVWNQAMEAGGILVGTDVKIEIESEFVRASAALAA
jgi:polyisoprenoid-binding protein YceI